ncbi:MAG: class I SAM-dependent methyltransferase, partial [Thermoproteota archaeon]
MIDLKSRLQKFWNHCDAYWGCLGSEDSLHLPIRQRAAYFIPEGSLVLDLGCGNAANSVHLRAKKCRYVGLDISLTGLRNSVWDSLNLVCGDAEFLPFRRGVFDALLATFVLEHSTAPAQLLSEMCRVVRLGGVIVLLGPTWDFPWWYPNSLRARM